jgi:hypothetical protein
MVMVASRSKVSFQSDGSTSAENYWWLFFILKLVVCILLRVLGQVQGFRLTQHWFEYFI